MKHSKVPGLEINPLYSACKQKDLYLGEFSAFFFYEHFAKTIAFMFVCLTKAESGYRLLPLQRQCHKLLSKDFPHANGDKGLKP